MSGNQELRPRIYGAPATWPFPPPDWEAEEQERRQREREAAEHGHTRDP